MKKKSMTGMYLTIPITGLMFGASIAGIFDAAVYEKETTNWVAQCFGQDFSNLFFVIPILLLSFYATKKGYRFAKIVWMGAMITNIYAYVIYCFSIHFNYLFHIYCAILGLSIFATLGCMLENFSIDFKSWFSMQMKRTFYAIFVLFIAIVFALLWFLQTIPATFHNTLPESAVASGLITNPVYVLDFSFYLPLMGFSAISLLRDKTQGYVLVPMMIIFAILTNLNIISLTIVSIFKNHTKDIGMLFVFGVFTVICLIVLIFYARNIKKRM